MVLSVTLGWMLGFQDTRFLPGNLIHGSEKTVWDQSELELMAFFGSTQRRDHAHFASKFHYSEIDL